MNLDLTLLNNLTHTDTERGIQATNKPIETQIHESEYKTLTETEKPLKTIVEGTEGIRKLQRQADAIKQDSDRSLAIYREYQENTLKTSQLQVEILKGAKAGESIYNLFLKAVKAISLMTSNAVFYSQLEGDIISVYGQGLLDPIPLRIELQETQEHLARLREAEQREIDRDDKERIQRAIKAHEEKIANLESLLHRKQTTA